MLQNKAMLANLTIRAWTARKLDRSVSREVEQTHGAKDAGNFNKLLIDKAVLLPIQQHGGRVRDYHYKMTLAWGDNGDRLLPSAMYMEYVTQLRTFRAEADKLADTFTADYPNQVQQARVNLGTLYNPNDYPPVSGIRARFGVDISFLPVPDAADFRVEVGADAVAEIRESITAAVNARQAEALKECWARLKDVVSKIEVKMLETKPIFRDSLIENAAELVVLLPKLNITNDAKLNAACAFVMDNLVVEPKALRNDAKLRFHTATMAQQALGLIDA
jgi:hypothetical protein